MTTRPWMPLYIADYRADTARLSTAEHGAYLLLIMEYWHAGGLPDDDKLLARIAGMSGRQWKKAKPTIQPLFQPGWKHKRIDAELERASTIAKAKSDKARDAANKRWVAQRAEDAPSDAPSNAPSNAPSYAPRCTLHTSQFTKLSEADASAAPADARTELFGRGLETLGRLAGRPPPACRPLLGRLLKSAHDDGARVLRAIDDAEQTRVADPVAWIVRAVQPRQINGKASDHRFRAALDRLKDHVWQPERRGPPEHAARLECRAQLERRESGGGAAARLLPQR